MLNAFYVIWHIVTLLVLMSIAGALGKIVIAYEKALKLDAAVEADGTTAAVSSTA